MIRSTLVSQLLHDNPGLVRDEVERIVDCFFGSIADQLAAGGRVELRGFGTFSIRARDARVGRNPRSGRLVDVGPKKRPFFRPGKEMRELVDKPAG